MNEFFAYFKVLKWIFVGFLALIILLVIPVKFYERRYIEVVLVMLIVAFILTILFGLSTFFSSMAVSYSIDREQVYFTYADKSSVAIKHSQIQQINCKTYRYTFLLINGKKIHLTRITGLFQVEKEIATDLKQIYSEKIIW